MSIEDIIYLAGYFDGEGCVTMSRNDLYIRVCSADRESIALFAEHFGGKVLIENARNHNKRQLFSWSRTSKDAQKFLITVLPYLRAKRDVALLGLRPSFGKRGTHLTEQEREVRTQVTAELHQINQRADAWPQ